MVATSKQRIPYIKLIQALAVIFVIIGHVTRIYLLPDGWYFHKPENSSYAINLITRYIYMFHMPLFVFLSGYLCEYSLNKDSSTIKFIIKRLKRLLIPFFVFGILYCVPIWMYLGLPNYNFSAFLCGENLGHLWFLPLLLWVSLLYLIFRKVPKLLNILILSGLVYFYLFNADYKNYYAIADIGDYLIFFFLGAKFFYLERKQFIKNKTMLSILGLISLSLFIFFGGLLNKNNLIKCDYSLYTAIFAISTIFAFSKLFTQKFQKFVSENKIIRFTAENMLYIYIFHEPVMEIYLRELEWGDKFSPVITCLILFVVSTFTAVVAVIVFNYVKRYFESTLKRNDRKE